MSNVELNVFKDKLETIVNQKQEMALRLSKVLVEQFLFDKPPTTPDEMEVLQCNYNAIQTLASAVYDYEVEVEQQLQTLVNQMMLVSTPN